MVCSKLPSQEDYILWHLLVHGTINDFQDWVWLSSWYMGAWCPVVWTTSWYRTFQGQIHRGSPRFYAQGLLLNQSQAHWKCQELDWTNSAVQGSIKVIHLRHNAASLDERNVRDDQRIHETIKSGLSTINSFKTIKTADIFTETKDNKESIWK